MRPRYRTGDQIWVRERNLAIILNYLWEAGQPISRAQLVATSGLNKSTVGSLLAQLQDWGFVRESGMSEPRPGRPGVLIDLNPDAGRMIGVEIGVGFISVIVTDMKARAVWQRKVETDGGERKFTSQRQTRVLDLAERVVRRAISEAASRRRLFGIGLGVPGLVDHATGTLLFAPNLRWRDVPLRDRWALRFGVPVIVENEANAAALGEQMLGAARGVDDFIYLSAGVGLGGGLVMGGRLYGGTGGFAGEVGHMTILPDGPQCNCGNRGCWETLVGPTAILRQVRQAAAGGRVPSLPALGKSAATLRMQHVLDAAAQGDPLILEVLSDVGRYLGIGIANLVNTFNPRRVVLGGVLSLAGPYFLPRARQEFAARALAAPRQGVEIALSAFKFDAGVMGGVSLILRRILSDPAAWQAQKAPEVSLESNLVLRRSAL